MTSQKWFPVFFSITSLLKVDIFIVKGNKVWTFVFIEIPQSTFTSICSIQWDKPPLAYWVRQQSEPECAWRRATTELHLFAAAVWKDLVEWCNEGRNTIIPRRRRNASAPNGPPWSAGWPGARLNAFDCLRCALLQGRTLGFTALTPLRAKNSTSDLKCFLARGGAKDANSLVTHHFIVKKKQKTLL